MPDLSLLAEAYQGGQSAIRAIRWIVLIGLAVGLAHRLVRGTFDPGSRRSPAFTALWLVFVIAGLIAAAAYDLRGDVTRPERARIAAGCTREGVTASRCDCYADELAERTDNDSARLTALREMAADARASGAPLPGPVRASMDACS